MSPSNLRLIGGATALALTLGVSASGAHADDDAHGPRSPAVATGLSLGATVLTWGLIGYGRLADDEHALWAGAIGAYLAPGLGSAYADRPLTGGFGLRTLGALGAGLGLVARSYACHAQPEPCAGSATVEALIYGGASAMFAGAIVDIAGAGEAARAYNRRVRELRVAPMASADGAGVALTGRF